MRIWLVTAIAAALLAGIVVAGSGDAQASGPIVGYPNSMASLGDSITRAMDADGSFGDQPQNSWSTGTSASVDSLYSHLLAVNPAISGNAFNDAVSGAKMSDLNGQAQTAVSQGAALVIILMGGNDVCTSSEATMTPVATYQAQFETAMQTISSGLPDARIAVVSIPDVYNLWSILHGNSSAQFIWAFASICQSLLANPTSMAAADVQRRADVRQRNIDDNTALHDVCAEYVHCRFDNYLAFNTTFTTSEVSTLDYFHPSVAGQALTASLAWANSYDFTDTSPPVSDSTGSVVSGGVSVQLTATDNDGVSGIEYKIGAGAYQAYATPVTVPGASTITWRAVDVNGNTEGTHSCRALGWDWVNGDSDCDGFTTAQENFIGTNPNLACGTNAWPVDLNNDGKVTLADIAPLVLAFNAVPPGPPSLYRVRYDLNMDNRIDLGDITPFVLLYNKTCE
jgi:lysophospholipase L1-like esterase